MKKSGADILDNWVTSNLNGFPKYKRLRSLCKKAWWNNSHINLVCKAS